MDASGHLKLSRSKLDLFVNCPRCFWMELRGKSPPIDMPMGLYNVLDSVQKQYYDKHRKDGLPPLLRKEIPFKLADIGLVEKLRSGIHFKDDRLNATLWGKMDDCFVDDKGRLVVMDNKTSSSGRNEDYEEGYKLQLDTYAFLLIKNGFKVGPAGYLIYYIPKKDSDIGKGVMFDIEPSRIRLDPGRIEGVFEDAVKIARKEEPPEHHHECEMCTWIKNL